MTYRRQDEDYDAPALLRFGTRVCDNFFNGHRDEGRVSCSMSFGPTRLVASANATSDYGPAVNAQGHYLRDDTVIDGDGFVTFEGVGAYTLDGDGGRIPLYRLIVPLETITRGNVISNVYRRNYSTYIENPFRRPLVPSHIVDGRWTYLRRGASITGGGIGLIAVTRGVI